MGQNVLNGKCQSLVDVADMVFPLYQNPNKLNALLKQVQPLVAISLAELVKACINASSAAICSHHSKKNDSTENVVNSISMSNKDVPIVFNKLCKAILQWYTTKPNQNRYKATLKGVRLYCNQDYNVWMYKRATNPHVTKILIPYKTKDLYNFEYSLHTLYKYLENFIYSEHVVEGLKESIRSIYQKYIKAWNDKNPIVRFKPDVTVKVLPKWGSYQCILNTTSGKRLSFYGRPLSNWLFDGLSVESYSIIHSILRIEQAKIAVGSPTVWLTLDNYDYFNKNYSYVSIQEVDSSEIDKEGNVRALSIRVGENPNDIEVHEGDFVFFKKLADGKYVPVNTNRKEAKKFIKRMQLLNRLSQ